MNKNFSFFKLKNSLLLLITLIVTTLQAQNYRVRPIQTSSITMSTTPLLGQVSYFANGLGAGANCQYPAGDTGESSLYYSPGTIFKFNLAQAPSASNDFNKINAFRIFIDPIGTTPGSPKTLTIKLYNGSTLLNSGNTNFTTFDGHPISASFQTIKLNNEYTNVTRAEVTILTGNMPGTIRDHEFALTYDYDDTPIISSISANQTILPNTTSNPITITATKPTPITPIEPTFPHVTYQWYSNTTNTTTGGTLIAGATSATYTPPASATEGTIYYYARVYGDKNTCYRLNTTSNIVSITNANCFGTDSDGDGVPDMCDLDDDNDGILDINECVTSLGAAVIWSGDGSYGFNPQIQEPSVIASSGTTAASIGSGLTGISIFASSYQLSGISASTTSLSGAIAQNDYVEYQFKTTNWNTSVPNSKQYIFDRTSVFHQGSNTNNYRFAVAISKDNFVTNTVLLNDLSSLNTDNVYIYKNPDYALSPDTQYKVRVYFYSLASLGSILFDNFTVRVTEYCDTDGDGIPDYLDLDSDNDGCLDAIEGGADVTTSQLVNSGGVVSVGTGSSANNQNLCAGNSCVNANGVPQLTLLPNSYSNTNGQSEGDSKNASVNSQCAEICTETISGELFDWNYPGDSLVISPVLSTVPAQPASDYGYTFDIYKLDNSFNMEINGVSLATNEIEFQTIVAGSTNLNRNVEFLDGSYWGNGSIQNIYFLNGDAALGRPIIRVNISPNGVVSLFASKVSANNASYQLYPVRFNNSTIFNTISWNTSSPNQVTVSQNVVGDTAMKGYGYGRKIVPCHCYKPSATSGTALETKHGITSLARAGKDQGDKWPMVRKGAWTALESKTKGLVVNRISTTSQVNAIPDPIEGMMVYDIEAKCLKVYTLKDGASVMAWHCMTTQACPSK